MNGNRTLVAEKIRDRLAGGASASPQRRHLDAITTVITPGAEAILGGADANVETAVRRRTKDLTGWFRNVCLPVANSTFVGCKRTNLRVPLKSGDILKVDDPRDHHD